MKPEGNILVLTQWSFKDALVQTYTLPYVNIIRQIVAPGRKIFLLTSEQSTIALNTDEIEEINKTWGKKGMKLLAKPYNRFGLKKLMGLIGDIWKLYRLIKKENIKTIHAVCTPAGGLAYILSLLTGANFIVDSYEPHAEAMVENGTWKKDGLAYKILFLFEKRQTQKATALIGTTAGMKQYAARKYGTTPRNFFVKPACVDLEKFSPTEKNISLLKELRLENKIVCVYAGKLGGIYLKAEVFDFISSCYDHWKDAFRFLMLTNAPRDEINTEMQRVGLPDHVVISKFVFHDDIPLYLSLGDFAINPVKPVPTKQYCTSIKDGEYWAMGLPVIISPNISDDSSIIEREKIGIVMDFNDKTGMDKIVLEIEAMLNSKVELKEKIVRVAEKYRSYKIANDIYEKIYSQT